MDRRSAVSTTPYLQDQRHEAPPRPRLGVRSSSNPGVPLTLVGMTGGAWLDEQMQPFLGS